MRDQSEPRYRTIPNLRSIVVQNEIWERSDGRAGSTADFSGADLRRADFKQVELDSPDFRQADLRGANLSGTYLFCADFTGADLRAADLTDARLPLANLTDARLSGASLRGADMGHARIDNTDFSPLSLSEMFAFNRHRTFEILHLVTYLPDFFPIFGTDLERLLQDRETTDASGGSFYWYLKRDSNWPLELLEMFDKTSPDSVARYIGAGRSGLPLTVSTDLRSVDLVEASIVRSDLSRAWMSAANLTKTEFVEVELPSADLSHADLTGTNFTKVRLVGANLTHARLIDTSFVDSTLADSHVYGTSVWGLTIDRNTNQERLTITPADAPAVEVDDLEVAQFIYLLLNRQKLRSVISVITSKAVLVLGRFTPDRKPILDGIANKLREHKLLPIIFDFERAKSRDFTETIKLLAGMSLFVIADITNPSSAPLELQAIVPDYQIPFLPIIQEGEEPFAMFRDLTGKYDWVMQTVSYPSFSVLDQVFKDAILDRAWNKHKELQRRKTENEEALSAEDFLKNDARS